MYNPCKTLWISCESDLCQLHWYKVIGKNIFGDKPFSTLGFSCEHRRTTCLNFLEVLLFSWKMSHYWSLQRPSVWLNGWPQILPYILSKITRVSSRHSRLLLRLSYSPKNPLPGFNSTPMVFFFFHDTTPLLRTIICIHFLSLCNKIPQSSAVKNNKALLSHNLCGSGIHKQQSFLDGLWPEVSCELLSWSWLGLWSHQKAVLGKVTS